jgi:formate C-acetyltransferase
MAKVPYRDAADGISLTATIVPQSLGCTRWIQVTNLVAMLDAFFGGDGHPANINGLNRETLLDAMEHAETFQAR